MISSNRPAALTTPGATRSQRDVIYDDFILSL